MTWAVGRPVVNFLAAPSQRVHDGVRSVAGHRYRGRKMSDAQADLLHSEVQEIIDELT